MGADEGGVTLVTRRFYVRMRGSRPASQAEICRGHGISSALGYPDIDA